MIDYLLGLLIDYKYWIVIGGALIEGETVLLIAAMGAFYGHLNIYMVAFIAFLGAAFHDHVLFFVGQKWGDRILTRLPKIKAKSARVFKLFHRYKNWFILSFRFIYGIRTITPIIIGTSAISTKRYSILTLTACFLWAALISAAGYIFASIIETVIETFAKYQKYFAGVLVLAILGVWFWRRLRRRRASPKIK